MQNIQVDDGAPPLFVMSAAEIRVLFFDWFTDVLDEGVSITESAFTVSAIKPSKTDTALTLDFQNDPEDGSVRLTGGTAGQLYEIANVIQTDEGPEQTLRSTCRVLVQN